jgi:DNA-binding transcriptional ArsR family regulator
LLDRRPAETGWPGCLRPLVRSSSLSISGAAGNFAIHVEGCVCRRCIYLDRWSNSAAVFPHQILRIIVHAFRARELREAGCATMCGSLPVSRIALCGSKWHLSPTATSLRTDELTMRPQAKPQVNRLDLDIDSMVANARQAAEFLKALSHESRLVILCVLVEGEKSVAEIEQLLGLRQPAVSQQLARLRAEKLVETRRDGKNIYYSLARAEVRDVIKALHTAFCPQQRSR